MFKKEHNLNIMFYPFSKFIPRIITNHRGVNKFKREEQIVISLTCEEANFNNIDLTIISLLNQNILPDRIILWISDKYNLSNLPYIITKFIKNGLEIKFVKDYGTFNKIIYPIQEFSNAIIVMADDKIYYPKDWLMKLYHSYIANPNDIHAHVAHKIRTGINDIAPFESWIKHINEENAGFNNFADDIGGVLFPPNCLSKEVLRSDIFLKNNITNLNIWLWFMSVLSDKKIRVVKNHITKISSTNVIKEIFENKNKKFNNYDQQIDVLMNFYKQNIMSKLK